MATHSLAISRELESAGIEKKHAEAIAEAVATHSDESFATKADIARLEGRIDKVDAKMDAKFNIVIGLVSALFIAFVVDKIVG